MFWLIFLISALAQDLNYAKKIIDTLSSPSMNGRGYVNNGMGTAADFINHEFSSFNLKNFYDNYFQSFQISINTFPDKMSVKIDRKELVPGIDYLVSASSKGTNGKFRIEYLTEDIIKDKKKLEEFRNQNLSKKVIVVDETNVTDTLAAAVFKVMRTQNIFKVGAVIFLNNEERLSWDCSTGLQPVDFLIIDLKKNKISPLNKTIKINIENKIQKNFNVQNIIGYVKGKLKPDSFLVFTAHYDHLGRMGKDTYFPGAHDNASGTAMMLNLAKYYSQPENQPDYSIAFMSFCCEEAGLIGSWYYTEHPLFPLGKIKFLINLDILGTGSEGLQIVNSLQQKKQFDELVEINRKKNYVSVIKPRGNAPDSDHYYFTQKNVPSIFIYTLGNEWKEYHTVNDKSKGLPLTKYDDLFRLIRDYVKTY